MTDELLNPVERYLITTDEGEVIEVDATSYDEAWDAASETHNFFRFVDIRKA